MKQKEENVYGLRLPTEIWLLLLEEKNIEYFTHSMYGHILTCNLLLTIQTKGNTGGLENE